MEPIELLTIEENTANSAYALYGRDDVLHTCVTNENDALMALFNKKFSLILLDAVFAENEFVNIVKNFGGHNFNTPVIVLLDAQDSHLKARFMAAGADDALIKPLNSDVLIQLFAGLKNNTCYLPNDYIQILLDKTQNNKPLAITIFQKLFAELPQQLMDIWGALQNQQFQAALDTTHKLHGSMGFCGFTDIQQYAYKLEKSLVGKELYAIDGHFGALKSAIQDFMAKETVILEAIKQ